eukprot:6214725-Pyramimonas_sp.AAC.1
MSGGRRAGARLPREGGWEWRRETARGEGKGKAELGNGNANMETRRGERGAGERKLRGEGTRNAGRQVRGVEWGRHHPT